MPRYREVIIYETAITPLDDFAAGRIREGNTGQLLSDVETGFRRTCQGRQPTTLGTANCNLAIGFEDGDDGAFLRAVCERCIWQGAARRAVDEAADQVEETIEVDRFAQERARIWANFVYHVKDPGHPLYGLNLLGVESFLQLPSGHKLKQPHALMSNLGHLQFRHEERDAQGRRRSRGPHPSAIIRDDMLQELTRSKSFIFLVIERSEALLTDTEYLTQTPRVASKIELLREAHEELVRRGYYKTA